MLLFVAGTPWKHLAALAALGRRRRRVRARRRAGGRACTCSSPTRSQRLTAFLHPVVATRRTEGYQQQESKIAIGSGRKTGRANPTQTQLNFVPEDHTDFIFAAVGEQYGFAGAGLVLLLYALLIWRALRVLVMSKDLFGSLIAAGVAAMLMFQVFVNVGMTIGIMPITGVTLPLMSYGGSSVITTMLAIGLLQSIYVQARASAAQGPRRALLDRMFAEHPHQTTSPAGPCVCPRRGRPPADSPAARRTASSTLDSRRPALAQACLRPARCSALFHNERLDQIEKASAGQRRPRGDARRAAGGRRNARGLPRINKPRPQARRRGAGGRIPRS